jgi:Cu2+-containing amine oxidase
VKEGKLLKISLRHALLGTIVVIVLLCALAPPFGILQTFSSSLPPVEGAPSGYDPLTAQEMDAAVAVALQAAGKAGLRAATTGGQEVLLVERHEASKAAYASGNWQRQGDVYVYDYATDTLIHTVVDVPGGAVSTVERLQGVQLPLTQREEQRALALVQADSALWMALADRYQAITAEPLQRLDQLQHKISVFHGDAMWPAPLRPGAALYGR